VDSQANKRQSGYTAASKKVAGYTKNGDKSMENTARSSSADYLEITQLMQNWGLWRDTQQWQSLRASFAPGASMKTTWCDCPADDFVDASIKMSQHAGPLAQHFIGASAVNIRGDRATSETRFILLVRGNAEQVEVDITCFGRFFDRLVRHAGRWVIDGRLPVYEKDSMQAVAPGQVPALDTARLASFPVGYRHLAYVQSSGGAQITTGLPAHNSPEQRAMYEQAQAWLAEPRAVV
jgi:hypothetical protein